MLHNSGINLLLVILDGSSWLLIWLQQVNTDGFFPNLILFHELHWPILRGFLVIFALGDLGLVSLIQVEDGEADLCKGVL